MLRLFLLSFFDQLRHGNGRLLFAPHFNASTLHGRGQPTDMWLRCAVQLDRPEPGLAGLGFLSRRLVHFLIDQNSDTLTSETHGGNGHNFWRMTEQVRILDRLPLFAQLVELVAAAGQVLYRQSHPIPLQLRLMGQTAGDDLAAA